MMSLVDLAYGSSEDSDGDEENIANRVNETAAFGPPLNNSSRSSETDTRVDDRSVCSSSGSNNNQRNSLFSSLARPKRQCFILPEDDVTTNTSLRVRRKEFKSVKITVPSLSEFKDVEEPAEKRVKSSKGSGLFAILPLPRNTITKTVNRPFVPHAVAQQLQSQLNKEVSKKNFPKEGVAHYGTLKSSTDDTEPNDADSGDDNDSSKTTDFFSLANISLEKNIEASNTVLMQEDLPGEVDSTTDHPSSSSDKTATPLSLMSVSTDVDTITATAMADSYLEQRLSNVHSSICDGSKFPQSDGIVSSTASDSTDVLNDESFLRFLGKNRSKREHIQFIDVSQDDQIPKYEEWLVKALTEEEANKPSRKPGAMPSSMQRRKHQITYLAFQAREREIELKNQWAENKFTRRQTQAKYGF